MESPADVDLRALGLRRAVLMVSVLDAIDAVPSDEGAELPASERGPAITVCWPEVALAIGGVAPESPAARVRLRIWLRLRRALADLADPGLAARPVGLPVDHVLHPGPAWVRRRVLGGALHLGTGFVGLLDDPDAVAVLPPGLLDAAGIDDRPWWPRLARYLEDKGTVAADRLRLDPTGPLRPIGDCDVVTLLGSTRFRRSLCDADPLGLRTAAVPMRRRGWLDLGRIDPAFAVAAASATEAVDRGFSRPLLITRDEVAVVSAGGHPHREALEDPPSSIEAWRRR
ncbi:MAG: hypothetical protein WAN48_07005 [Actinomycetes bacterium]